ncbi:MAG: 4-hydroxythreonine-4-phosphate dehydrogenase PdxA, partial [Terrimicrobiaceae bacterium]|nr:4-hydroxythreonine-4-phosphate dehydrogenase PdxA [Terrimicrobiaceae bacterium]
AGCMPPRHVEAVEGPGGGFERGTASAASGLAAYRALMRAVDMALLGEVRGIVTAPLSKAALHMAGIFESGHTEILAKAADAPRVAMLLHSPEISCAFATCHQSLASVPASLTRERILDVARLTHAAFLKLRGRAPRIALPALNPHAGEGGIFGSEELEILAPAARAAREEGIELSDPLPADTAFLPGTRRLFDAYLCLYHDQGGIPFKMLAFDHGVNVTLGLPFARTSPDHGTAYDIAWKGLASARSMIEAALLAAKLAGKS